MYCQSGCFLMQEILKRNNVKVLGNGTRSIIFAPGFGCDQNVWRFVAPAFEKDYRVILFDYVGMGQSSHRDYSADRYSHLAGYAQDILEVCQALDLREAVFVGHSVSSVIGMLASIREPERFARLVLVGPSPCYLNHPPDYMGGFERADLESLIDLMDRNYIGWAKFLAPLIMKNTDRPSLEIELRDSFCSTDPTIARRFAIATFFGDNREDLPKVTVPSLILQCADDAVAPLQVGQYVHRHLRSSTLRLMEATGHCPHMSHPEETIRLITEDLEAAFA